MRKVSLNRHQSRSRPWIEKEGDGLVVLVVGLVIVVSVLPLARLAWAAIAPTGVPDLALFETLAKPGVWRATRNTLVVGLGSAAIALGLGLVAAIVLATTDLPGKRVVAFLFVLSLMVAPHVVALAFKTLAGPASPLLNSVGLAPPPGTQNPMLGAGGIILVMGLHHAPLAAITLAPGLAAVPRVLIEAAMLDGARGGAIVYRILLPMLRPYLMAATMVTTVAGLGNFGIPALLGLPVAYQTLPTLVYQTIASFGPRLISDAAAISMLIALLTGAGVVTAALFSPRDVGRLEGDVALAPFIRLGTWRWPAAAVFYLSIIGAVLLPFASLVATSLVPAYGVRLTWETLTLRQFHEVLVRQPVTLRAFRNSLLLAGSAAAILAVVAVLAAYTIERRLGRWRSTIVALAELPYALPGIILSIGCILLLVNPLPLIGISLYATPWIILFAYIARFLPLAVKPVLAAMATITQDQEEAAAVMGARLGRRLWSVVLPRLLAPASAGAMLVLLLAFNELTVSALLWSAGAETLGVALLSLDDAGLGAEAAAVGVTATLVVAVLMLILDRLSPWMPAHVLPWRALTPDQ